MFKQVCLLVIGVMALSGCDFVSDSSSSSSSTATASSTSSADLVSLSTLVSYVAEDASIAMDGNGNGIAVWRQFDGDQYSIFANYYTASTDSWGTAIDIDFTDTYAASNPQVAMNSDGNAMAVWSQSDGTNENIYANRYDQVNSAWGGAALAETTTLDASKPKIGMPSDGDAIIVWLHAENTQNNVYYNIYDEANAIWGTEDEVFDTTNQSYEPSLSVNSNGDAAVVWRQNDGTGEIDVNAEFYTANAFIGAPVEIDSVTGDAYSLPQVAISSNSVATAVWLQTDGTYNSVYSSRYDGGWTASSGALIETLSEDAYEISVAMDSFDNAIAVFNTRDASIKSMYATRYKTAWNIVIDDTYLIESSDSYDATLPSVAMDATSGNAVAVWLQNDGTANSIYASTYTADTSWATAATLESDGNDMDEPYVVIDEDGKVVTVWADVESSSTYSIYAERN